MLFQMYVWNGNISWVSEALWNIPTFLNDSQMTPLKTKGHVEIRSFCQVE